MELVELCDVDLTYVDLESLDYDVETSSAVATRGRGRAQPGSRASRKLATATKTSPRGNAISVATEPMNVPDAATHSGTRSVNPSSSTTAVKNKKATPAQPRPAHSPREPTRPASPSAGIRTRDPHLGKKTGG